ncbi:MAG: helix-turn-helix domain-containing protein [Phascolarctobacterium sp.]|nr:helix-turn-helix domain-containing protein [Phascolarctobacterium sp.]
MYILNESERKYDEVLTIKELMDFLAIGKNTAYGLVNRGEIKSFKIGRNYKVYKENVYEYMRKKIL